MSMPARNRVVALLIVAAATGCATAPAAVVTRGTVTSRSPRTQAVVNGPMKLHAYAGFTGGEIYQAPASRAPNADCVSSHHGALSTPIPADRVVVITVPAGAVACLQTSTDSGYELLWHGAPEINHQ